MIIDLSANELAAIAVFIYGGLCIGYIVWSLVKR